MKTSVLVLVRCTWVKLSSALSRFRGKVAASTQARPDQRCSKMKILTRSAISCVKPHWLVAASNPSISSHVRGCTCLRTIGRDFSLLLTSEGIRSIECAQRKNVLTIDQATAGPLDSLLKVQVTRHSVSIRAETSFRRMTFREYA